MLRPIHSCLLLSSFLLLAACDEAGWESNGGGGGGGDSDNVFAGPNDFWELDLEDAGTFTLTRKNAINDSTPATNVEGNYTRLGSGFTRFNMTNAVGGINTAFAGIEVGNELVLLAPVEAASRQILALMDLGSCPTSVTDGNWIKYNFTDAADTSTSNQTWFGTWRYNPNNDTDATFGYTNDYSLANMTQTQGGSQRDSGECDDGLATSGEYSDYLSSSYVIANIDKDVSANNEYVLGFPITNITSSQEYNGSYVGFMYQSESNFFATVSASCTDGTCQIYNVTDINNVNNLEHLFTITMDGAIDRPSNGFFIGTVQNQNNQVGNIACGVTLDVNSADDDFLACVGQYPTATVTDVVNFFLLSTD